MNSHQSSFDEIRCPNCGEKIPVTEVIYHQIAEQTREELKCESAEQQAVLSEKIRNLQLREAELDRLVEERVNAGQARLEQEALNKARQILAIEIEDLRAQSNEKAELLAASQRAELELRKKAREFEERERALSVEVQRKLDEGRALIEEQVASRLLNVSKCLPGYPRFSAAWETQWRNPSLIKFANFQIAIFRRDLDG
jgi:hypothetical protein